MALKVVLSDAPISEDEAVGTLFVEPSGIRRLYQVGHIFLLQQRPDLCQKYWRESLRVANTYRGTMLADSLRSFTAVEAVERFGPVSFAEAVTLASSTRDSSLREELWRRSEVFWTQLAPPFTREQQYARAIQLRANQNAETAETWIKSCLSTDPDHLKLRILLAEIQEKAEKFDESLNEWYRIRYLEPHNATADRAIQRLNEKQKKAQAKKGSD
jgi:hypothetical protein